MGRRHRSSRSTGDTSKDVKSLVEKMRSSRDHDRHSDHKTRSHRRDSKRDRRDDDQRRREAESVKCAECSGRHPTAECPFTGQPEEWHEFYDAKTKAAYYFNTKTGEKSWSKPKKVTDPVLWCCQHCNVLLPTAISECIVCHEGRLTRAGH